LKNTVVKMKNYFDIIPFEILFIIIDSMDFGSRWALKNFALTCKLFYFNVKQTTKSIEIISNEDCYDFDLFKEKELRNNIFKDIQFKILFKYFKTFQATTKKFEHGDPYFVKEKVKKYIIPKYLFKKTEKYVFLYKLRQNYIIDIKNNIFYKKTVINFDSKLKGDLDEDEGYYIVSNKKYFLFTLGYFNHLLKNKLLKIIE
jgi:hypothetical protein